MYGIYSVKSKEIDVRPSFDFTHSKAKIRAVILIIRLRRSGGPYIPNGRPYVTLRKALLGRGGLVSSKQAKRDSAFPAEQVGDQQRRFLALFLGLQHGKPFAGPRMRGVDFEKLGIDRACASRELHFF
jgi:hypothetical protein